MKFRSSKRKHRFQKNSCQKNPKICKNNALKLLRFQISSTETQKIKMHPLYSYIFIKKKYINIALSMMLVHSFTVDRTWFLRSTSFTYWFIQSAAYIDCDFFGVQSLWTDFSRVGHLSSISTYSCRELVEEQMLTYFFVRHLWNMRCTASEGGEQRCNSES